MIRAAFTTLKFSSLTGIFNCFNSGFYKHGSFAKFNLNSRSIDHGYGTRNTIDMK